MRPFVTVTNSHAHRPYFADVNSSLLSGHTREIESVVCLCNCVLMGVFKNLDIDIGHLGQLMASMA